MVDLLPMDCFASPSILLERILADFYQQDDYQHPSAARSWALHCDEGPKGFVLGGYVCSTYLVSHIVAQGIACDWIEENFGHDAAAIAETFVLHYDVDQHAQQVNNVAAREVISSLGLFDKQHQLIEGLMCARCVNGCDGTRVSAIDVTDVVEGFFTT